MEYHNGIGIFSLRKAENTSAVYQFLCEKILPFYASLRGIELYINQGMIFANNITDSNATFLKGVCNGYAFGVGLVEL